MVIHLWALIGATICVAFWIYWIWSYGIRRLWRTMSFRDVEGKLDVIVTSLIWFFAAWTVYMIQQTFA